MKEMQFFQNTGPPAVIFIACVFIPVSTHLNITPNLAVVVWIKKFDIMLRYLFLLIGDGQR